MYRYRAVPIHTLHSHTSLSSLLSPHDNNRSTLLQPDYTTTAASYASRPRAVGPRIKPAQSAGCRAHRVDALSGKPRSGPWRLAAARMSTSTSTRARAKVRSSKGWGNDATGGTWSLTCAARLDGTLMSCALALLSGLLLPYYWTLDTLPL
jgi:hypothetical protein